MLAHGEGTSSFAVESAGTALHRGYKYRGSVIRKHIAVSCSALLGCAVAICPRDFVRFRRRKEAKNRAYRVPATQEHFLNIIPKEKETVGADG
jgi:hypothetical protein